MKIVVDTNIVFSAILNPSAMIGQILIYGQKQFNFFAPNLVKDEIKRHRSRIISLSEDLEDSTFEDIRDEIFRCLNFVSEEQIPYEVWHEALPIVRDTDMDDIAFVAMSAYLDATLWTGDKKLIIGLEKYGFKRIITTEELSKIRFGGE